MIIDPRIGLWLSIALAIVGVASTSATQLTTILGQHTSDIVVAFSLLLMTAGNAVNAILHAIPSSPPTTAAAAKEFPLGPKASAP
jgi:hypothetical protein